MSGLRFSPFGFAARVAACAAVLVAPIAATGATYLRDGKADRADGADLAVAWKLTRLDVPGIGSLDALFPSAPGGDGADASRVAPEPGFAATMQIFGAGELHAWLVSVPVDPDGAAGTGAASDATLPADVGAILAAAAQSVRAFAPEILIAVDTRGQHLFGTTVPDPQVFRLSARGCRREGGGTGRTSLPAGAQEDVNRASPRVASSRGRGRFAGGRPVSMLPALQIAPGSILGRGTTGYGAAPGTQTGGTEPDGSGTLSPVPLPAGWGLLAAALGGLAIWRRRTA